MVRNNTGGGLFLVSLSILLAIIGFTPILQATAMQFVVLIFLITLTAVFWGFGTNSYKRDSGLVSYVLLYFSLCLVYKLFGISSIGFVALIRHTFFFLLIPLLFILTGILKEKEKNRILIVSLLVVAANIIDNIRLCLAYPELAAIVNRNMYADEIVGVVTNIGGSHWYNSICFFFAVCFFAFLNSKEKAFKNIMLACSGLAALFIFGFCLKASIIVFSLFAVVMLYFAKRSVNQAYFFLIAVLSTAALLLANIFSDEIILFLSSNVSSGRLASRLISLIDSESEEAAVGASSMSARIRLWMVSVDTWTGNILNFIFGIGDHHADVEAGLSNRVIGIGNHSDFFDTPARYGVIGLILIYKTLKLSFKKILSFYDRKFHLQLYVLFGIFILFGFTKGVFLPAIGFVLFILLPLVSKHVNS